MEEVYNRLGEFNYDAYNVPNDPLLPYLGPYEFSNGNVYEGQFSKGKPKGRGKILYSNGSLYEGEFDGENCNVKGRLIHADGDYYQGTWVDNFAEGLGSFIT